MKPHQPLEILRAFSQHSVCFTRAQRKHKHCQCPCPPKAQRMAISPTKIQQMKHRHTTAKLHRIAQCVLSSIPVALSNVLPNSSKLLLYQRPFALLATAPYHLTHLSAFIVIPHISHLHFLQFPQPHHPRQVCL